MPSADVRNRKKWKFISDFSSILYAYSIIHHNRCNSVISSNRLAWWVAANKLYERKQQYKSNSFAFLTCSPYPIQNFFPAASCLPLLIADSLRSEAEVNSCIYLQRMLPQAMLPLCWKINSKYTQKKRLKVNEMYRKKNPNHHRPSSQNVVFFFLLQKINNNRKSSIGIPILNSEVGADDDDDFLL